MNPDAPEMPEGPGPMAEGQTVFLDSGRMMTVPDDVMH